MEELERRRKRLSSTRTLVDCLFLLGVVFASSLPYVSRLGFYVDDWQYIPAFTTKGLIHGAQYILSVDENIRQRPVQLLYLALTTESFGLHPLPYHLGSSLLVALLAVCLYVCIRDLHLNRWIAFTVALIYGILPHYSTDRIWISSQQAVLCMIFALLGIRALNRAVRTNAKTSGKSLAISALFFTLSLLAYEVALGLIVAALAVAAWQRFRPRREASERNLVPLVGMSSIVLLIVFVFIIKLRMQASILLTNHPLPRFFDHLGTHVWHAISQMMQFNVWTYGLHMLQFLTTLQRFSALNWTVAATAMAITFLVSAYVWNFMEPDAVPARPLCLKLIGLSAFLTILGYGLFLQSPGSDFNTAGIANRVAIAAALGPAFLLVGISGLACSFLPIGNLRTRTFGVTIGLICGVNCLAIGGIGSLWAEAADRQADIVKVVAEHVNALPQGSTLILDGFCRYRGPGIVFETGDSTSAIQLALHDPTLNTIVMSHYSSFNKYSVDTPGFGSYRYGDRLFVFNTRNQWLRPLQSQVDALKYLREIEFDGDKSCLPAQEGHGEVPF